MQFVQFCLLLTGFMIFTGDGFCQSRKYLMKRVNASKAVDKEAALAELIEDTKKDFKPTEYDYFESFSWAGMALFEENKIQALKYLDEARDIYKRNHLTYKYFNNSDYGWKYLMVLSTMQTIHLTLGSAEFLPVLEREQEFINTLSAKTRIDYHLMLVDTYLMDNKLGKAESSLAEVKLILDSKVRLTAAPTTTDKATIRVYDNLEKVTRQSTEIQYSDKQASLMSKLGNTSGADSVIQEVARDREKLNASLSKRVQKIVNKKSDSRSNKLWESFYGYSLDSALKIPASVYFQRSGIQPLPATEPEGYFEKIRYYNRKKDSIKSQRLIAEARAVLQGYDKPSDAYTISSFDSQLDNLESVFYLSQGSYDHIISTRLEPLKKLDATLIDAIPYFSEKELKSFFAKYQSSLNQYLSALSLSGTTDDAIKLFEKSVMTRGLLLSVSKQRSRIIQEQFGNHAMKELKQIRNYRERANYFAQQIQVATDENLDSLQFYESKILQLQRDLNNRLGISIIPEKSVTWKEIQRKLKPGECFVFIQQLTREYFDPQYYEGIRDNKEYWMIFFDNLSSSPKLLKIGDESELYRGVRYYQNAIKTFIKDNLSYDLLWKPIADVTGSYKKIYFSADGFYHFLNPYTLFNMTTQKYVLDETEIVRLSQLNSFVNPVSATQNNVPQLVLIGNPDFSMNRRTITSQKTTKPEVDFGITENQTREGLNQLPGAEREVTEVSKQANKMGFDVTLLIGIKATESNVKKISNPDVLHLATHGLFETDNNFDAFLRSKIVLAGVNDGNTFTAEDHSKYEDGWLTAFEVTQLNLLKTKLVVLSACETAIGDLNISDGVYGLQRAFEIAGATNVMGSLWAINDQATATFMTEFYNSYLGSGNTLGSYRTAMIATRKKFSHPNYWGSFILNGRD